MPLENATTKPTSEKVMPIDPISKNGFLPILSISDKVMKQATKLITPLIILIKSASDSEKPTACQSTAP